MAKGAAWMMAVRWCIRGLDLLTTIILARLLAPDDFGLFATGTLIVGFLEILSQAGLDLALIRKKNADRSYYDAAWTIQVLQGVSVALLLILAAPWIAQFFGDERVVTVVRLLALKPALMALTNIGVVLFLKELDYSKEFWYSLGKKVSTVAFTLVMALILRDYMAMVWGVLAGAVTNVLLSYLVHPYRPRFAVRRMMEVWGFSGWIMIYYGAEDLVEKLDKFVVGRVADAATLGRYHLSWLVSTMPLENLVVPLWRALVPVYAQQADEPKNLARTYLNVFALTAAVSFAAGFGMISVAEDLVLVMLGEDWRPAVPLVQWMALIPSFAGVVDCALMIISVTGHARLCALHSTIRLVTLLIVLPIVGYAYGPEAIVRAFFVCAACLMPIPFFFLVRIVPVTRRDILSRLWRPVLAGLGMWGTVRWADVAAGLGGIPALALQVAVGGLTYVGLSLGLWVVSGCGAGAEATLIARIREKFYA